MEDSLTQSDKPRKTLYPEASSGCAWPTGKFQAPKEKQESEQTCLPKTIPLTSFWQELGSSGASAKDFGRGEVE